MIGVLGIIAQLAIVAHAPDSAVACDAFEISVAVSTPGRVPAELVPPNFGAFEVLRSSPFPHLSFDSRGGFPSVLAEYRYIVASERVGMLSLPAFEARLGTATARSRPLEITMRAQPGHLAIPTVVARARIDTTLGMDVRALTRAETVFVGQQANYEVAVFLNRAVRERLRRNPTFFPPDMQSMLAYDLPANDDATHPTTGSRCFDALVYQRALFPLMPGKVVIPPAQLVYALPLSSGFFSREESHELQTDSTVIVAVDPPLRERPSGYGGAVGNLHVAARLDTTASRVGDPLVLTVRVAGTGNVKLLPRPAVSVPWATLVSGGERVSVDSTRRKIAGSKEFDWVLTPRLAGELDVPPIRYPYFNPDAGRYELATSAPAHVSIGPGSLASADTGTAQTALTIRPRYRGAVETAPHQHPAFWVVLALVPLPAFSRIVRNRREARQSRAARAAGETGSELLGGALEAPSGLRRAFIEYCTDRLRLTPEAFTRAGAFERALRRRGVAPATAAAAEQFLRRLDTAAFAADGNLPSGAQERAQSLLRAIDGQALSRTEIRHSAILVALVLSAGVGALHGAARDPRAIFDAGVAAYGRREYSVAREAFLHVAIDQPSAPDAWANLGTAAWALADTARGVAAWQRALRLEPLAEDMRARVELVHVLPTTASGFVTPIPPAWLFDAAAVAWIAAWLVSWVRLRQRRAVSGMAVAGSCALAGALLVYGAITTERLAAADLGVVRRTEALRTDPALSAPGTATAITAEVVRIVTRQGGWTRIQLDDGREGWVASGDLLALDRRDVSTMLSN